ncbi:MAG: hypothetical protein IPQ07_40260 [Myxococcales bacterium]|nr:hypothetical protein [Myxococcales bacterium]
MTLMLGACGGEGGGAPDAPPLADSVDISDHGTGSVTGTVHGEAIQIVDAISVLSHSTTDSSTYAFVVMSTHEQCLHR